jgi:hypothetical protein
MKCSNFFIGKLGKKNGSTVSSPGGDGAIVITYYYPPTVSFTAIGSSSLTIPNGVLAINVKLWGAGGAGTSATTFFWGSVDSVYAGGSGSFVSCDMAVTGGTTIYLLVGQGGRVPSYGANSVTATGGGGICIYLHNIILRSFDQ